MNFIELQNIHLIENLKPTKKFSTISCVKGKYQYYHYKCDGFDDVGWGCGYRTTQTLCSWLREQLLLDKAISNVPQVPTILEIQKILADSGDKPSRFVGSKEWIGCFESSIVIDTLFNVPCKILHCEAKLLENNMCQIKSHFETFGGPIMMGGDFDAASNGVLGITSENTERYQLLIADPHLNNSNESIDINYLVSREWISWKEINAFDQISFYNFCLPQKKCQ